MCMKVVCERSYRVQNVSKAGVSPIGQQFRGYNLHS